MNQLRQNQQGPPCPACASSEEPGAVVPHAGICEGASSNRRPYLNSPTQTTPLAMSTTTFNRIERRKLERASLKEQRKSRAGASIPQRQAARFPVVLSVLCIAITATVVAVASPAVRSWFTRPTPLQIAPNQTVIHLDDGGLAYTTDGRITALHESDPRHRQLIGLQYTVGSVDDTDYHPLLWRSVDMSLKKPDGSVAEVSATRPLWWFEITKAKVSETVPLDIHEAGISGMATVHKITSLADKPYESATPGYHPVIGTIKHLNAKVIELTFEGAENEPLGVTSNHPLWSEDREDWIPAGEIRIGEMVATTDASARLLRRQAKPGLHTVYNIEVHRTHSYHVGSLGLMAHNTGLECERVFSVYERLKTKNGKTVNEAFEWIQTKMPNVAVITMGKSMEEAMKDVGFVGKFWTKGRFQDESAGAGMNAYNHFLKHRQEFPDIKDAVSLAQKAHRFCDEFPVGPDYVRWVNNGQEFFINKATKEVAIRITTGDEAGALATYYVRSKPLEQWARSNGFTGTF